MNILLIEDDADLCDAVSFQLRKNGYTVDSCNNGGDADFYIESNVYDAIVLDRLLPVKNGIEIIKDIRNNGNTVPVIMVTAMDGINDRILGLDSGADDYLVKPFSVEELMARLRALMRRPKNISEESILSYADLVLNKDKKSLICGDTSLVLSKKEYMLLEYFIENSEKVLSRDRLIARVWGSDSDIENGNLDNYIHFLRRRLKSVKSKTSIITVYSQGYRLEVLKNV